MKTGNRRAILAALLCATFGSGVSAQVVARYDAGLGDRAPPVSPDQYTFNGQTWTAALNTNVDVTVGPVSPDGTNCVNAWNVSDNSTNAGLGASYSFPLSAALSASANSNGWELTVVSRMVTNPGGGFGSGTAFIQFGDTNTQHRFLILLNLFPDGTLAMQYVGTNGATTGFSQGTNYHTHKLVYSAATGTVKYYVDWQLQVASTGWTGDYSSNTIHGPAFGVMPGSARGSINFKRVDFGIEPPGPVAKAIHYIQIGPFPQRTAIQWDAATNSGGPAIKEYIVNRNGLEQRALDATWVDVFLQPCHDYEFTVQAVDTNGTTYAPSLPFPVTSLPAVPVTGVRKVKVLLLNFPDYPGEPFTTNYANDLIFSNSWGVNAYFQENSYGQLTLQGDSAGWYTMPHYASNYCAFAQNGLWYDCNSFQLSQDALSVLPPDQTNNLNTYQNFVMVFQGAGAAGIAAGIYKIISATNGFRLDVIGHELGHLMDPNGPAIMHASGWPFCKTYPVGPDLLNPAAWCQTERYSDDFDVMGAANTYHLSMYHKEMLGFLKATNIQVAAQDGDYTLYSAEIVTNAVQMIKIPLEHEMFYFLEYRRPLGFNGPSTPMYGVPPVDAVLLRLRVVMPPGTDGDTLRPKVELNPGTPFIDPYRGLRVEVTQKLGDHIVVRVTGTGKPLRLTDIKRTGPASQSVQVTFNSVNGATYFIQSTSNLTSWVTEQTNVAAGAASTTNVLSGAGGSPQRMFRVGVAQ